MSQNLLLYWLTESGCEMGTPLEPSQIDPAIRERVLALTAGPGMSDIGPLTLRLPFFDRRESRRRAEILRGLQFVREGHVIRSVPPTQSYALRDQAATLIASHPAWLCASNERHRKYFQTWQSVSAGLQRAFRRWIPEFYFRDVARFDDREAAYPLLVYQASRICRGRPRTEFTYDMADPQTLPRAMHMIGRALQDVLRGVETRLHAAGRPELARRYGPIWHEDVLRAVQKKPRPLLSLLGDEAVLINAVIGLGTRRRMEGVKPFARVAMATLRNICGEDMQSLASMALKEATSLLENRNGQMTH